MFACPPCYWPIGMSLKDFVGGGRLRARQEKKKPGCIYKSQSFLWREIAMLTTCHIHTHTACDDDDDGDD